MLADPLVFVRREYHLLLGNPVSVSVGSIIRCMRRLEELLRQMCQAAKAIGNTELENKFAEGKIYWLQPSGRQNACVWSVSLQFKPIVGEQVCRG